MTSDKKICFVIMGFGKKTDFRNERTLDLDKTYEHIIEPAVIQNGYECIRADAIKESGIIDRSMYALLLMADLVVADISTYNPNALYELGIRHAAKPYATIILKDNYNENEKIPFDLNHDRIFQYKHLGEDIGATEAARCVKELAELIRVITETPDTDSPLYTYWNTVNPLNISEADYRTLLKKIISKNDSLSSYADNAKIKMTENNFIEAALLWEKASDLAPNEVYYIQQEALCVYKSKHPSEEGALYRALSIIDKDQSIDIETLSIKAAILKSLYYLTNNESHLDDSIDLYNKAYVISGNYYPGENYALCLLLKGELNKENKKHYIWQAKEICQDIISNWGNDNNDVKVRTDKKWVYATLANCYYILENNAQVSSWEDLFKRELPEEWELNTYNNTKGRIANLLSTYKSLSISYKQ